MIKLALCTIHFPKKVCKTEERLKTGAVACREPHELSHQLTHDDRLFIAQETRQKTIFSVLKELENQANIEAQS